MHHGVYATAAALAESNVDPADEHALLVAAAMAATGRNTVASHQSAALMHGIQLLERPRAGAVTLTRPCAARSGRLSRSGIRVHTGAMPADHTTELFRVPVTTAARTVADLARTSSFMAAVVAADSALRQSKATRPELDSVLSDCARWPGTRSVAARGGLQSRPLHLAAAVPRAVARDLLDQAGISRGTQLTGLGGVRRGSGGRWRGGRPGTADAPAR